MPITGIKVIISAILQKEKSRPPSILTGLSCFRSLSLAAIGLCSDVYHWQYRDGGDLRAGSGVESLIQSEPHTVAASTGDEDKAQKGKLQR